MDAFRHVVHGAGTVASPARRPLLFALAHALAEAWPGDVPRDTLGRYREWKIHEIDPESGTVLRTIESDRFVTRVTLVDGELWHGTWEGDESDLRRFDPRTEADSRSR